MASWRNRTDVVVHGAVSPGRRGATVKSGVSLLVTRDSMPPLRIALLDQLNGDGMRAPAAVVGVPHPLHLTCVVRASDLT
jgi:hypothetical protein